MHFQSLLPLALLSSAATAAFAHAAPPNPDQLYALQQSAFSAAAEPTPAASHGHGHRRQNGSRSNRSESGSVVKRHQHIQAMHHGRAVGGAGTGMEKRRVERRAPAGAQRVGGRKEDGRGRERRAVVDSSTTEDDLTRRDDLEARGEQYPLANAGASSAAVATSAAAAKSTADSSASTDVSTSSGSSGYWRGVSSYYLHALGDGDRAEVLDAIKGAGFKVVRIFIASVDANNKGSNSRAVNDLEPSEVGTYDDTILELIDQLMVDCKSRGLKLLIAMSDRYALGFWSTDSYAAQLNIVTKGTTGAQKVADAASFYTNTWAIQSFEARLAHIMNHKNALLGWQKWADLDEVIYAVEAQNEPQGYMGMASSTWACDRAQYLKSIITSNIKVSSGGGITTTDSLGSWATGCSAFDIVSVHDYGTTASVTAGALAAAQDAHPEKEIIMGEWGMAGEHKAALISQFVAAFKAQGIPNMFWQITKPGAGPKDFEVWTDEPAWQALTGQASTVDAGTPDLATSKAAAPATVAAATVTKSANTQWASATSVFSSYAAKASSHAAAAKSHAASVYSAAASQVESIASVAASKADSAPYAAASKANSAAYVATSVAAAAVSASAAGQR